MSIWIVRICSTRRRSAPWESLKGKHLCIVPSAAWLIRDHGGIRLNSSEYCDKARDWLR
jgi:hypothetical protein